MLELVGAVLAAMVGAGALKKKLYCLWIDDGTGWECHNPAGNSMRRCRKAAKQFAVIGTEPGRMMILAKGIKP